MSSIETISETTLKWGLQRELQLEFEATTQSTNDNAKQEALKEREELVLYIAGHQTAGRGRGSNQWLDTGEGDSLLCTWSLFINNAAQAITGPRIGLAVFTALSKAWPSLNWSLKAPNDLFLDGKKAGGLLVETVSDGSKHRLLVGLGINVLNHPRRFSEATHLAEVLERAPEEAEWFAFLDELRDELLRALPDCQKPTLGHATCQRLMAALNANSSRAFTVKEISPEGDLVHDSGTLQWSEI